MSEQQTNEPSIDFVLTLGCACIPAFTANFSTAEGTNPLVEQLGSMYQEVLNQTLGKLLDAASMIAAMHGIRIQLMSEEELRSYVLQSLQENVESGKLVKLGAENAGDTEGRGTTEHVSSFDLGSAGDRQDNPSDDSTGEETTN